MKIRFFGDYAKCSNWFGLALKTYRGMGKDQTRILRPDIGVEILLRKQDEEIGEIRITAKGEVSKYSTRFLFFEDEFGYGYKMNLVVAIVNSNGDVLTDSYTLKEHGGYNIAQTLEYAVFDLADPDKVYLLVRNELTINNFHADLSGLEEFHGTEDLVEKKFEYILYRLNLGKSKKGKLFIGAPVEVQRFYVDSLYQLITSDLTEAFRIGLQGWRHESYFKYDINIRDMYVNENVFKTLYSYRYETREVDTRVVGPSSYNEGPCSWEEGFGYETLGSFPRSNLSWKIEGTRDKCHWTDLFGWDWNTYKDVEFTDNGMLFPLCILNEQEIALAVGDAHPIWTDKECGRFYILGGHPEHPFGYSSKINMKYKPKRPFFIKTFPSNEVLYEVGDDIYSYQVYETIYHPYGGSHTSLHTLTDDDIWEMLKNTPSLPVHMDGDKYSVAMNIRLDIEFSYGMWIFDYVHFAFLSKHSEVDLDSFANGFYIGYVIDDEKENKTLRGTFLVDWADYAGGGLSWSNPIFFDGFYSFPITTYDVKNKRGKVKQLPSKKQPSQFSYLPAPFDKAIIYPEIPMAGTYLYRNKFNDIDGALFLTDILFVDKENTRYIVNGIEIEEDRKPIM